MLILVVQEQLVGIMVVMCKNNNGILCWYLILFIMITSSVWLELIFWCCTDTMPLLERMPWK